MHMHDPPTDTTPPALKRRRVCVEIVSPRIRRSRTEPSLPPPPPTPPSSRSLPTLRDPDPPPRPARNIRTYAGSSRSFLVALPVPAVDVDEPRESYADLRTRWGIDLSEDDPVAAPTPPAEHSNDLKSITELRSKGESRRFLDEVGYLFEGLDSSSAIGLRRASALEVVNKLCDPDFNRRAKTSDFYIRTWDKLRSARAGMSDKVLDATISFFAALAARDPRTLTEVAQQEDFVSVLVDMLGSCDHTRDVLALVLAGASDQDLKSHGVLRTEITALKSLAKLLSREFLLNQPSARFFVSHSLATLPSALLADHHLPTLLANLRAELRLLEPRIAAYVSGLSLLPPNLSLGHIEACLRLLDSYLLGHWSLASSPDRPSISHEDDFTSELISLCIASSTLLGESSDTAQKCLCGSMRVLTLLSHDDPWWGSEALQVPHALPFTAMTAMRSQVRWSRARQTESSPSAVEAFDLLCLSLGLIMNWATLNPRVAVLARTQSIDPTCTGTRRCVRACQCPGQTSILKCLTTLHVQYRDADSDRPDDDPPECAFLRGYTAILLGLLIKDETANQTIVTSTLPGASPRGRIKTLVAHCRAFLDLYNDTSPPDAPGSRATTPDAAAHEATGSRHRGTWDKRGEEIAQSVIASLEIL